MILEKRELDHDDGHFVEFGVITGNYEMKQLSLLFTVLSLFNCITKTDNEANPKILIVWDTIIVKDTNNQNGQRHGFYTFYAENGSIDFTTNYQNGRLHG